MTRDRAARRARRDARRARQAEQANTDTTGTKAPSPPGPIRKAIQDNKLTESITNAFAKMDPTQLASIAAALATVATVGYAVANENEDNQQAAAIEAKADEATVASIVDRLPPGDGMLGEDLGLDADQLDRLAVITDLDPAALAALPGRVDLIESALTDTIALTDRVTQLDRDIAAVAASIPTLPTPVDLAPINTTLASFSELLDTLGAASAAASADVAALAVRLDTAEAGLNQAQDDLAAAIIALEAADEALANVDTLTAEQVAAAQVDAEAAAADAADALAAAEAAAADIAAIETGLSELQADVDDVEQVFYADLQRQWATDGMPLATTSAACPGMSGWFSAVGGIQARLGVDLEGADRTFCTEYVAQPPAVPAACVIAGPVRLNADATIEAAAIDIPGVSGLVTVGGSMGTGGFVPLAVGPGATVSGTVAIRNAYASTNFATWASGGVGRLRFTARLIYPAFQWSDEPTSVSANLANPVIAITGNLICA